MKRTSPNGQNVIKRAGFYFFNNQPYVSVTKCLSVIAKPAIKRWSMGIVYDALKKNPSLTKEEAMKVPRKESWKAIERGKTVHSLVELWEITEQIKGKHSQYKGYIKAFENWLSEHDVTPLKHELQVRSDMHRYAGRLDLLAMVDGKKCLIDVKTNKNAKLFKDIELQLSAYEQALREGGEFVERCYGLSLGESGKFKFKSYKTNIGPFLAARDLWMWRNQSKCKKVGYSIKFRKGQK